MCLGVELALERAQVLVLVQAQVQVQVLAQALVQAQVLVLALAQVLVQGWGPGSGWGPGLVLVLVLVLRCLACKPTTRHCRAGKSCRWCSRHSAVCRKAATSTVPLGIWHALKPTVSTWLPSTWFR